MGEGENSTPLGKISGEMNMYVFSYYIVIFLVQYCRICLEYDGLDVVFLYTISLLVVDMLKFKKNSFQK